MSAKFLGTTIGMTGTIGMPGHNGGTGGAGYSYVGLLQNYGTIFGGSGGGGGSTVTGSPVPIQSAGGGGTGGAGVFLASGAYLQNEISGFVYGGTGGAAYVAASNVLVGAGGNGGAGVVSLANSTVHNEGHITGGVGGASSRPFITGGAGGQGVYLDGAAYVINFGTITGGAGNTGVNGNFSGGGGVGVQLGSTGGYFLNQGVVQGGAAGPSPGMAIYFKSGAGVYLHSGAAGTVGNGELDSISGYVGISAASAASLTITNFGLISGSGQKSGGLVESVTQSATVINHGVIHGVAQGVSVTGVGMTTVENYGTLSGGYGLLHSKAGGSGVVTLVNSGTIIGTGGTAVKLVGANDLLVMETGAAFTGSVAGGGGTLEVEGGITITGLGVSATMTGGVSASGVGGFAAYVCGGGVVLAGANAVESGQVLTIRDTIQNIGTLSVSGGGGFAGLVADTAGSTLTGGGVVVLNAKGIITGEAAGASLTNVDNTITGGGFIESPLILVNESAGVIDANSGRMLISTGNTVTNDGLIEATGATGLLLISSTTIDSSGGGTVEAGKQIQLSKATLLGGGLTIDQGGILNATVGASMVSAATVTNSGTLEAHGGSLTLTGAVTNTGLITAAGSALTITGGVMGSGKASVSGAGTLEIDGAVGETLTFATGATGQLILGDSAAFTGIITGLSKTGANSIDLKDIVYGGADTVTFKANKNANSGGVLTVSDGTHTSTLKLGAGNYSKSTFTLGADSGTGVIVTDPTAHAFIAAMAGFAPVGAAGAPVWRHEEAVQSVLVAPHHMS